MIIETKKINNEQIKLIPVPKTNPGDIKGYNIISYLYGNIFLCAQKRSGKTNVIYKIIDSCIDSDTKVIVFCSTHNNDDAWQYIKQYFEKNKIQAVFYSSLFEDGIDQLENLLHFMQEEGKIELEEKESNKKEQDLIQIVKFDNDKKSGKIVIKKKKKQVPKYLIIFDDLSIELKKQNVPYLLKTFRHYKSKVIVSTQYLSDVDPQSRMQFDLWLLFKNHTEDKLQKIYGDIGCDIEFQKFYEIYKQVTSQPYHFLYIDKNSCTFRDCFTHEIELKS